MGFEPTFSRVVLVGGFRSPQVPHDPSTSLSIRSRKVTPSGRPAPVDFDVVGPTPGVGLEGSPSPSQCAQASDHEALLRSAWSPAFFRTEANSGKRVNPPIKTAAFTSHELGISERVGEQRDPLIGGDEGNCEIPRITSSHRAKLFFRPINAEREKFSCGPFKIVMAFIELRTERSHWTAILRRKLPPVGQFPHKCLQSGLWSAMASERREPGPEFQGVRLDHGPDEFVLGFEVVVDVAHRDVRCVGNVCE